MGNEKFTIYSAINPHIQKDVSIHKYKEYLKCKFWKASRHEAWMFFYCYFPPPAIPSLCRLLLILSGRLFNAEGFDEALARAWNLSEKKLRFQIDIKAVDDPKYKKIIKALDEHPHPKDSLIDGIVSWAISKKLISDKQAAALKKHIESIRSTALNHVDISEEILLCTLSSLVENNLNTIIMYHDVKELLFPNHELLDEIKHKAYPLSDSEHFYFNTRSLMKWLMQKGYLSEQITEAFRSIKIESIKENLVPYEGHFHSLQKLMQQGHDRDDLLYEALQGRPLYWKYPMDCKCKRNLNEHCSCNNGVRWEKNSLGVKYDIAAEKRLDGFGQLKKNENDDTFGCLFGGLTIDMLRHNKLPKTSITHYTIELIPTKEEIAHDLQPNIIVSKTELIATIANDRLGFLENVGSVGINNPQETSVTNTPQSIQKLSILQNHMPEKCDINLSESPSPINHSKYLVTFDDQTPPDDYEYPIFEKENKIYFVRYKGKSVSVPINVGLERLAYLIYNSDKEISALALSQQFNLAKDSQDITYNSESPEELLQQGISSHPFYDNDDILSDETINEYKAAIDQLNERIEDANDRGNTERANELTLEKEQIEDELFKNLNRKGKSRKNIDPNEKARSAVSHTLSKAVAQFKEILPELYKHLREEKRKIKRLQLGSSCIYRRSL
jgi:hypothetical protein